MMSKDKQVSPSESKVTLPSLSSKGMIQSYSESLPLVGSSKPYPQVQGELPPSPLEVVVVDDRSRLNEKPMVLMRIAQHHYNLIKGCTYGQLSSNSTYNKLYINLLIHDYKVLINGHEAFDKMMFLEEQSLPIRETMALVHGIEGVERVERNVTMLRLSLMAIGCFWLFSLFGFVDGVMDIVLSQHLTSLLILSGLSKGFFFMVCSFFYLAYGYHTYATLLDRFISAKEYFKALRSLDAEAWFPFFYK